MKLVSFNNKVILFAIYLSYFSIDQILHFIVLTLNFTTIFFNFRGEQCWSSTEGKTNIDAMPLHKCIYSGNVVSIELFEQFRNRI